MLAVLVLALAVIVVVIVGITQGWFASPTIEVKLPPSSNPVSSTPPPVTPPPVVSDLVGSFYADDNMKLSLNGTVVYQGTADGTEKGTPLDWTTKKNIKITNVKAGDKIGFIVTNTGGPGGFTGKFNWNGKDYLINSKMFSSATSISPSYATVNTNSPATVPYSGYSLYGYTANQVWPNLVNGFPQSEWVWTPGPTGSGDAGCDKCTNTYIWTVA